MKNQNVLLQPFTPSDLPLFESWLEQPFIYKWFCPSGEADKQDWLDEMADISESEQINQFVIVLNDQKIGFAQCIDISTVPDYVEEVYSDLTGTLVENQAYELSYLIGEESLLVQGLGKMMIQRLVEEVKKRGGRLVLADPGEENTPSVRVLLSNGFVKFKDGDYRKDL